MNPLAWHSGTVFLQCAGCKVHHKVVDHLNLTTEFNLTAEGGPDNSGDGCGVVDMQKELERLDRLSVTRSLMPNKMRPFKPQGRGE